MFTDIRRPRCPFVITAILTIMLFLPALARGAGKPPKPPAAPINPAIVYVTSGGSSGFGNLGIANVDGTNQKIILSNGVWNRAPSWSPDGNTVVFVSNVEGPGIYRLSIDRNTAQAVGTPRKIAVLNSLNLAKPVWSPMPVPGTDRYFVAYSDSSSPNGNDYSVHLVDPDADGPGGEFKLSSPVNSTAEVGDMGVTWSPDASLLAVTRGRDSSEMPPYDIQIVTLQVDCPPGELVCEVQPRISLVRDTVESELRRADTILNPAWGNTGSEIAVSAHIPPDSNSDIWAIPVLSPETARNITNTNKIIPPDRHETLPTWSRDDSQVAYRALGNLCNSKDRNFQGIVVRNVKGDAFPDGCKEKILIKDGNFPSWWPGPQQP